MIRCATHSKNLKRITKLSGVHAKAREEFRVQRRILMAQARKNIQHVKDEDAKLAIIHKTQSQVAGITRKMTSLDRDSSYVRLRNMCKICWRPRFFFRDLGCCRICLRKHGHEMVGMKKGN